MRSLAALGILILLMGSSSGSAAPTVIGGGVVDPANGNTYYLLTQDTWTNSEAMAVTLGGTLATVTSDADNTWISTTFGNNRNLWFGLWDPKMDTGGAGQTHTNNFVWANGSTSTYRNWGSGEPNDATGNEYYTMMWGNNADISAYFLRAAGVWNDGENDLSSQINQPFGIVEVATVPEPSPVWLAMFGAAAAICHRKKLAVM